MAYTQLSDTEEQKAREAVIGIGDAKGMSVEQRLEVVKDALNRGLDPNEPLDKGAGHRSSLNGMLNGHLSNGYDNGDPHHTANIELANRIKEELATREAHASAAAQLHHGAPPPGAHPTPTATHPGIVGEQMSIADAQRVLKAEGLDLGDYGANHDGIDNKKGQKTTAAIKEFQRDHGIEPSGELNAATVAALREEAKEKGIEFHGHEKGAGAPAVGSPQQRPQPGQQAGQPVPGGGAKFDGADHITQAEMNAALAAGGFSAADTRELNQRLRADNPRAVNTAGLNDKADAGLKAFLVENNGIEVNGQHLTPQQAAQVLGSANGKGGIEDQRAGEVLKAVDAKLEAEHPDIQAGRSGRWRGGQVRDDGGIAGSGIDSHDIADAARGLTGLGRATHVAELGDLGKVLGGAGRAAGSIGRIFS